MKVTSRQFCIKIERQFDMFKKLVGPCTIMCLNNNLTRARVDVPSKVYSVSRYSVSFVVTEEPSLATPA